MKPAIPMILFISLTAPVSGFAKAPPEQAQQKQAVEKLRVAMTKAVQQQAAPPGQAKRPVDPDQGDDHASARAIAVVCSKDTPAAQRSAICPVPVSPQ